MEKAESAAAPIGVSKHLALAGVTLVTALSMVLASITPAQAAPNPANHYPAITLGTPPITATATFPGASNLTATVTTGEDMNLVSGASVFLPATRGMGVVYGSSKDFPYLSIKVDNTADTTATIELSREPAATRFAFALGDIDAETLVVSMKNANGNDLTAAEMGAQTPFNQASTSGPVPTVTLNTNEITVEDPNCPAVPAQNETCDTDGATAWFQPTVAVQTITITSTTKTGFPRYQLWMAYTDSQVVSWAPTNTTFDVADSPVTPDQLASVEFPATGGGAISYAVDPSSTSDCSVDATTAEITAATTGSCLVTATAQATTDFDAGSRTVTFTITTPPPPAPPASTNSPRETVSPDTVVVASGPGLAATGAPAWPVWAAGLLSAGVGLVLLARLTQRSPVRASRLS